jgi:hypothetical protein
MLGLWLGSLLLGDWEGEDLSKKFLHLYSRLELVLIT